MRELFVYYRIRLADVLEARKAVAQLQNTLRRLHPGLTTRLLHRPETRDGEQTWMEVYAVDPAQAVDGVGPVLQAEIETSAASLMEPWLASPRHVEVFLPAAP